METTSSREVYRNPWTVVREDTVRQDDGSTGLYGVVVRPDYGLVVPAQDGGFWLVEQYRHPLGRRSWEFPQGGWPPGRTGSAEDLARAELAEETGLRAGALRHLGRLDEAPGLSTQRFDVWLATDLTPGPTAREASEADMVQAFVPEAELVAGIRSGAITDASTLAAPSCCSTAPRAAGPPSAAAGGGGTARAAAGASPPGPGRTRPRRARRR